MKKIKILAISDDIRIPSGVGIQCKKILTNLQKTGKFDCVELGCSELRVSTQPVMVEGIKVYPTGGGDNAWGSEMQIRTLVNIEKPDIIIAFSDPRFFITLLRLDNEIRPQTKIVLYHTWDNDPFPSFNLPLYAACDQLVMISEFAHQLMTSGGLECEHIPHMQNTKEFYPLSKTACAKQLGELKKLVPQTKADFIIFYNNRNLTRKRTGDILEIFKQFYTKHLDSLLVLNTKAVDLEGTDLLHLQQEYYGEDLPIIFNFQPMSTADLNVFYNIADVTINISHSEGFGLCVQESLFAGTPVLISKTGGMPEQMTHHTTAFISDEGKDGPFDMEFGKAVEPAVRHLFGVPGAPFIFQDFVSYKDVLANLEALYDLKKAGQLEVVGKLGRDFVVEKYNEERITQMWVDLLEKVHSTPSTYKRLTLQEAI